MEVSDIHRFLSGFAVDTNIGNRIKPDSGGRAKSRKVRQFRSGEEVLLHIADAVFYTPLLISLGNAAGRDAKPVILGKIKITWIKNRRLSYAMFEYGTLKILCEAARYVE